MKTELTNNLHLQGPTVTVQFGPNAPWKANMRLDLTPEEARILAGQLLQVSGHPTFAVGAYVPQGEIHPVLVPVLTDGKDWHFVGPVHRRGEPLFEKMKALFSENPLWLFSQNPINF